MKFCVKCGVELFDEAVICPKCGCFTPGSDFNLKSDTQQVTKVNSSSGESTLVSMFNFLATITSIIALFMFLCGIFDNAIYLFDQPGEYSDYHDAYFAVNDTFLRWGIIPALTSLCFGVTTFVLSLVKRQRGSKLFSSITKLIVGFLLLLASCNFWELYI
jgi:hypothetical protein